MDRIAQVLEFQAIRVDGIELDALDPVAPA
jgi:hypothetical protein